MTTLRALQKKIAETNRAKGWYDVARTFGEGIALIHSEVSEALEAYRSATTPDLLHEQVGLELADIVIRTLDEAERQSIDLQTYVDQKMLFNMKRLYRHGGKRL